MMSVTSSVTKQRHDDSRLLKYANSKRIQERFNDITIKVENKCFSANRLVLSCFSGFFETMFQLRWNELHHTTFELGGIDSKSMQTIIEFIYTGTITIDDNNVMSLLAAADYLLIDEVKRDCFEFLKSYISTENCFNVLDICSIYDNKCLEKKVYQQITNDFEILHRKQGFLNIKKTGLVSCISNLNRNLVKETSVYNAVMRWIKHDVDSRKKHLVGLFQLIKLNLMSKDFLVEVVLNEKLIEENPTCLNQLHQVLSEFVKKEHLDESKTKLLCLGGSKSSKVVEIGGVPGNCPAVSYPDLPVKLSCHSCLLLNDTIYIVGGRNENKDKISKAIWFMNLKQTPLQWQKGSSLKVPKCQMGATVHKNCLVVAGGENDLNDYSSITEIYIELVNEWKTISSLNHFRYGNALISSNDGVFCIGGSNGNKVLSSVEHLSDFKSNWKFIEPMLTPRMWFAAVWCNNEIYAIGGQAGEHGKTTRKDVEKYKPALKIWVKVSEMNIERHSHTACVLCNKIYVVGGINKDGKVVKEIECYDTNFDKWSVVEVTEDGWFDHAMVAA